MFGGMLSVVALMYESAVNLSKRHFPATAVDAHTTRISAQELSQRCNRSLFRIYVIATGGVICISNLTFVRKEEMKISLIFKATPPLLS